MSIPLSKHLAGLWVNPAHEAKLSRPILTSELSSTTIPLNQDLPTSSTKLEACTSSIQSVLKDSGLSLDYTAVQELGHILAAQKLREHQQNQQYEAQLNTAPGDPADPTGPAQPWKPLISLDGIAAAQFARLILDREARRVQAQRTFKARLLRQEYGEFYH